MLRSIKFWVQCTTSLTSSSQPKIKTIFVKQYHQFSNSTFQSLPTFFIISKFSLSDRKKQKARTQVYSNYKKNIQLWSTWFPAVLSEQLPFFHLDVVAHGTDIQIVGESLVISSKYHYPGDQLPADRGFALEEDFAAECSSEFFVTAFTKGQKQMTVKEIETTSQI